METKKAFFVYNNYDWETNTSHWKIGSIKVRRMGSYYVITGQTPVQFGDKTRFHKDDLLFSKKEVVQKKIDEIETSINFNTERILNLKKDLDGIKKLNIS